MEHNGSIIHPLGSIIGKTTDIKAVPSAGKAAYKIQA